MAGEGSVYNYLAMLMNLGLVDVAFLPSSVNSWALLLAHCKGGELRRTHLVPFWGGQ